jgi:hypothetical protein
MPDVAERSTDIGIAQSTAAAAAAAQMNPTFL